MSLKCITVTQYMSNSYVREQDIGRYLVVFETKEET